MSDSVTARATVTSSDIYLDTLSAYLCDIGMKMISPQYNLNYEHWAPVFGRVLFALLFLAGALLKIPFTAGFAIESGMTAAHHVPLPAVAVFIRFVIELVAAAALIVGYRTRMVAFWLMLYSILLTLIFHSGFESPEALGQFISQLGLIAGLLYLSVYGAQYAGRERDVLPHGVLRQG